MVPLGDAGHSIGTCGVFSSNSPEGWPPLYAVLAGFYEIKNNIYTMSMHLDTLYADVPPKKHLLVLVSPQVKFCILVFNLYFSSNQAYRIASVLTIFSCLKVT